MNFFEEDTDGSDDEHTDDKKTSVYMTIHT